VTDAERLARLEQAVHDLIVLCSSNTKEWVRPLRDGGAATYLGDLAKQLEAEVDLREAGEPAYPAA
jgi:hypothetical protein